MDDPFVRQLVTADLPLMKRWMAIEVSVLALGCGEGDVIRYCLSSQPLVTLDWLRQCGPLEIVAFTRCFDCFRLVLEAREVPKDELLAAGVRTAAAARPEAERWEFLVAAGRELVRMLGGKLLRLEGVLRRVRVG